MKNLIMSLNLSELVAHPENCSCSGCVWLNKPGPRLPSGYFRKVESVIGKEILKIEEDSIVVLWIDDLPIKILCLNYGDIVETQVIERSRNKDPWEIMNWAEQDGVKIFHVDF
ncbi:hypothetical protein [Priestia megaterium]|uniref:hypothetical protein n=1 Tax=Priestia megaterium TaxID=1404 RepID=UPI00047089AF|nr:hypothetical protein [Priestia megaterium]PFB05256.1 hypothetical protein CN383_02860 [Priestia megaterium]